MPKLYTAVFFSLALFLAGVPLVVYAEDFSSVIADEEELDPALNQNNNAFIGVKVQTLPRERVETFPVPILGVKLTDVVDSWGDARANGRSHEGTDILAPRGAFILSPTDAIVARIGTGTNGGKYVYTYNPGGERLYFAHLDGYAPGLAVGQALKRGDLIGFVGNTGNAASGPPHLHLGIYNRGAQNPYPRIKSEFSFDEAVSTIARVIEKAEDPAAMAVKAEGLYKNFLTQASNSGVALPPVIETERSRTALIDTASSDLELHARGTAVTSLQQFLIAAKSGPAAESLAQSGATGYFGPATKQALIEFQKASSIAPATGYYGPKTRAVIAASRQAASAKAIAEVRRITFDLEVGDLGDEVIILQEFLISEKIGPHAESLAKTGATGVFGPLTKKALAEFQAARGIAATGYFGPKTRAYLTHVATD